MHDEPHNSYPKTNRHFAENDSHPAFSECVNERTVREKKYLWVKMHWTVSKARAVMGWSVSVRRFPKIFGLSIPKFPKWSRKKWDKNSFSAFFYSRIGHSSWFQKNFRFYKWHIFSLFLYVLVLSGLGLSKSTRWQEFKPFVLTR